VMVIRRRYVIKGLVALYIVIITLIFGWFTISGNMLKAFGFLPYASVLSAYALSPDTIYSFEDNAMLIILGIVASLIYVGTGVLLEFRKGPVREHLEADTWDGSSFIATPLARSGNREIRFESVSKTFQSTTVLDAVSARLPLDCGVCILGGRGSGRSTLIKCMLDIERPTSGTVTMPLNFRMCYLPETPTTIDFLTVNEHLSLAWSLSPNNSDKQRKLWKENIDKVEFLFKNRIWKVIPKDLTVSDPQSQKLLNFAMVLISSPEIVVLDCPTTSFDLLFKNSVLNELHDYCKLNHITAIWSTPFFEEAENYADYLVHLDEGRVTVQGSMAEIRTQANSICISVAKPDDLNTSSKGSDSRKGHKRQLSRGDRYQQHSSFMQSLPSFDSSIQISGWEAAGDCKATATLHSKSGLKTLISVLRTLEVENGLKVNLKQQSLEEICTIASSAQNSLLEATTSMTLEQSQKDEFHLGVWECILESRQAPTVLNRAKAIFGIGKST